MKRFRFSLQALLTLRQRQEHLAMEGYGAALRAHREALQEVARAEQDLACAWNDLRRQLEACCTGSLAAYHRSQCVAVEDRGQRARQHALKAERKIRESYLALIEARRQRQIVDRLQTRRRDDFEREIARQEGKVLDELAQHRPNTPLNWQASS